MRDITEHSRINTTVLTRLERPALRWLAGRVARWVSADGCTLAGVVGAVLALVGYVLSAHEAWFVWLASAGVVLHWLGDSLDGTVARLRNASRPRYGFFVDHLADTVCEVLIFLGLGLSPYVTFTVACLSLVSFQSLAILVFLRACVVGEFRLSYGGLGPTEAHLILLSLNTVMVLVGPAHVLVAGYTLSAYDFVVAAFGVLTAFHFVHTGSQEVVRLARLADDRETAGSDAA
jgi:archaetidylinositol phosphate synthase